MPDFDKITRQVLKSSSAGDTDMIAAIRRFCPKVIQSIEADQAQNDTFIVALPQTVR